jgi:hypothetical protein
MITMHESVKHWAKLLLISLPALICLAFIYKLHFPVLVADDWRMVELAEDIDAGNISFDLFWRQHNEHRILFPRLIYLAIAYVSGFDNLYIVIPIFLLLCLYFLVVTAYIKDISQESMISARNFPVALILGFLVFSLIQRENLHWGFQIGFVMCLVFSVMSLYFLFLYIRTIEMNSEPRHLHAILSVLFGIIASFSSLQGLVVWLAGSVSMFFYIKRPLHSKYYLFWNIIGICTIVVYFINAQSHHMSWYWEKLSEAATTNSIGLTKDFIFYFLQITGSGLSLVQFFALFVGFTMCCCFLFISIRLFVRNSNVDIEEFLPYSLTVVPGNFSTNTIIQHHKKLNKVTIIMVS